MSHKRCYSIVALSALLPVVIPLVKAQNDPYDGSLDRSAERGAQKISFKVPGDRPDELCVLPVHLPFAKYRGKDGEKDLAAEKQLASYDFYKAGNTSDDGAVGICPKSKSTSAAVQLMDIPKGSEKPPQETALYCTTQGKSGKCLAKFKQTDNEATTTSSAADLAYYHLSRILGDVCEIKPVVLRTMDIEQHKKVLKLVSEMGIHGTVRKSWDLFNKYYANPRGSSVARQLFTSDFTQIYGALIQNTSGEENYAEWLRPGDNLGSVRAFRNMADSRPAKSILGSTEFNQSNVQALVGMRDMSEMILVDYLMSQSDRLTGGNISDYDFVYFVDGDKVKGEKASKADDVPAGAAKVTVKKLTIKDTDAGLLNGNLFEKKGYLSQINHLHPETYRRLVDFADKWKTDPTVKQFFHRECTLTNSQIAKVEKYLLNAATVLQAKKASGKLQLDLDLDDYFHPTATPSP